MIKAVIFDFDGVVADTMTDNCTAWQESFARYNFQVEANEYFRLEGMGRYQIADYFIEKYKLDAGIREEVVTYKEQYYKNNNSFGIYAGIDELFSYLNEKGLRIAIVTGASRARITEHLTDDINSKLSALVTADDVMNTKPNPEPYLKAIGMLGLAPEDCLVIENAILGIKSAKAAGCMCFALETTLTKEDLEQADEILPDHERLLKKIITIV